MKQRGSECLRFTPMDSGVRVRTGPTAPPAHLSDVLVPPLLQREIAARDLHIRLAAAKATAHVMCGVGDRHEGNLIVSGVVERRCCFGWIPNAPLNAFGVHHAVHGHGLRRESHGQGPVKSVQPPLLREKSFLHDVSLFLLPARHAGTDRDDRPREDFHTVLCHASTGHRAQVVVESVQDQLVLRLGPSVPRRAE